MNKLEIIKKYIRVNEVGKAQNLIFKSITDSNISVLQKREIIDLFVITSPQLAIRPDCRNEQLAG